MLFNKRELAVLEIVKLVQLDKREYIFFDDDFHYYNGESYCLNDFIKILNSNKIKYIYSEDKLYLQN